MAWPLTPLLTFVNGSSPACDAVFLNNLQAGVNGLTAGTYSFAAVTADGTGGVVTAPTAGQITGQTLKATTAVGGTSMPTATTTRFLYYKEMMPLAIASVHNTGAAGTLNWGVNISSLTRTGAGSMQVNLVTAGTSTATMVPVVTPNSGIVVFEAQVTSTSQILVVTETVGLVAADSDFFMVVYGG